MSSSLTLATTRPMRASCRSWGTVINYAEVDDEGDDDDGEGEGDDAKKDRDHIPDAGALDDDVTNGDFVAGNGRRVGRPSKQQQQVRADSSDLDQSYLGLVPPARFIKSRGFLSNTATAQGGLMFALDYSPNYLSPLPSTPPPHPIPNPILIPVRLKFDVPELGLHIRNVFLWNLHELSASGITPEVFAAQFCRDLDIGVDPYGEIVARQIRVQVEDARGEAWVGWMDSLPMLVEDDEDNDEDLDQHQNTECRAILSLDVQISTHHLTDHIEWDLLSPLTPEAFSLQLCGDLGLSGEAIPLIAHAVHEELCRHRQDVVDWGVLGAHPPLNSNSNSGIGGSVGDSEGTVKDHTGLGLGSLGRPSRERDGQYPKPLRSAWRDWAEAEEYATRWEVLSPKEVERREVERERAGRRLRRETSKWRSRR
ncbi:SNF5-domain-containing protein [Lentinula edodes]|nr:SNF5-domain-containing protein [Lentinula edodes]